MEEKYIVANNLVLYRKKAGMSQLELAEKLNYSNKNISKWEKGDTTPSVFVLNKIAKIYGVSVDAFLQEQTASLETVSDIQNREVLKKKKIFRFTVLALINAILFAVASIFFYVLGLTEVTAFNKWLAYVYICPLCVLSVIIFIRVIYKYVTLIGLTLFNWLFWLSIYLSLISINNSTLLFVLALASELIVVVIGVLVNLKLSLKFQQTFRKLLHKKN